MNRLLQSLGLVLTVCVVVRVAAWLVEPVLPLLGGLFLLLTIFVLIVGYPRHRR